MNVIRLKWWFYKNYAWIGIGLAVLVAILLRENGWQGGESIAGFVAIVGYFHFVQNQRLGETQLFKDLFTEFNIKYDGLNEELARVQRGEWTPLLEGKVIDYFNLCSEEYLFFKQGYIHPEAWESWRRGMCQYLAVDRVRKLWQLEVTTDSYYGLTLEVMLDE